MIILLYIFTTFDYQEIGGSNSALLISSVSKSSYVATLTNPAVLAQITQNGCGVVYSRPYNIELIQYTRVCGNYKNYGISISRLGQSGYQEYNFSLSAGFNIRPELSYGFTVKGLYLNLGEYGQSLIPAVNFGLVYQMDKLKFGAVLENINNPQTSVENDVPLKVLVGTLYEPVSDLFFGLEITKTTQYENLSLGTALRPMPNLAVRIGTQTNPFVISGGIGFIFKSLYFDYTLKFHSRLQDTSILSLGCFW